MDSAEADAGVTYVGGEPLGRVRVWPLFEERYRLLVAGSEFRGRDAVDWAEIAALPLALLTNDMQNRRIIDRRLERAGADIRPVLESNSMIVLMSHVRTRLLGQRASGDHGRYPGPAGFRRRDQIDPDQGNDRVANDRIDLSGPGPASIPNGGAAGGSGKHIPGGRAVTIEMCYRTMRAHGLPAAMADCHRALGSADTR